MLLGVFAVIAIASLYYIHVQTQSDAVREARKHAAYAARVASKEMGQNVKLVEQGTDALAASPATASVITHPERCALQATGYHTDLIGLSGRTVCSSLKGRGEHQDYSHTTWFHAATQHPVLVGPVRDPATGKWVLVSAAPLFNHRGVAESSFYLEPAGPQLAGKYSGGEQFVFTVVVGRRVLIRSIAPAKHIGKLIKGQVRFGEYEALDRDGVARYFATVHVPGTTWAFSAGIDKASALAPANSLERRQFGIILVGLVLMLGATMLAYWAIAAPIARLRKAVQGASEIPQSGMMAPKEVHELGRDIGEMVARTERQQQAERMAALGQLASGVAHDFNNVLLIIRTHAERLLRRPQNDAEVHEGVSQIDKAAERGAELAHQLLAFSRQRALAPTPTDVNEVVRETMSLIERVIGEHIRARTALAEELPPVLIDRGQLSQIILNLAINARDAMDAGGVLTIRSHSNGYVVIEVTDTGIGMNELTRARVFDPFFTTKGSGGTGLGLATVRGIVEGVGGVIDVESELGEGATFRVHLPAADAEAIEKIIPPIDALGGDETILLIEDEDVLRPLIADTLRFFGYTVLEARDGEEALRIARSEDIALVLADVILPGEQGDDVVGQLLASQPHVHVLFTSGIEREQVRPDVPAENFIAKPYTPDELARKVREVLDS